MIYALLAIWSESSTAIRVGGLLFFVGIVALPLGAVLFWTGKMKP
jgi:hypothetical protein